ncbi:MAG: phosphotransferase [Pseudomonadota bacterium]
MSDPTAEALALWGLSGASCTFVAGRENRVYKVVAGARAFALRFKRPGYHSFAELMSELDWLAEMERAGLKVPKPMPSKGGKLLEEVAGHFVDIVTWVDGAPIGKTREPLALEDPIATFSAIGAEMARLHEACDAWDRPPGFVRCRWDADGLVGEAPRWGRFWENPTLDADTRKLLEAFRAQASRDLARLDLDTGLIHADLVRENVLLDGNVLRLIDFDDGGFGYRLFDIATALLKNRNEPNYTALKTALVDGYLAHRPLDIGPLDLFLALRAVTYVGWIVPRMEEPGAELRNTRFIKDAQDLCSAYLATTSIAKGD